MYAHSREQDLGSVHCISWLPRYHLNLLPQLVHLLLDDSCTEREHHQQITQGLHELHFARIQTCLLISSNAATTHRDGLSAWRP